MSAPADGRRRHGAVPLGERAYDIVVGRGLLDEAGRPDRAAPARRPPRHRHRRDVGARCTRERLDARRSTRAGPARSRRSTVPPGEATKSFARLAERLRRAARRGARPRRPRRGLRRRRGRRPRGLRGRRSAARHRLRADPDHAAGPGRLLGRRQDRHRLAARQEPDRRLPPAEPGAGRHRRSSTPCRRARCAPATPRWSSTACSATPRFFDWLRGATARRSSRGGPARDRRRRAELPRQGRDRRARRARGGRPRAAQPRPHLRPRAGSARPATTRPPAARRGASRSAWRWPSASRPRSASAPRPGRRRASRAHSPPPACRRGSPTCPAAPFDADGLLDAMAQDKKVEARPPDLHPRPRHRRGFVATASTVADVRGLPASTELVRRDGSSTGVDPGHPSTCGSAALARDPAGHLGLDLGRRDLA